MVDTAPYSDAVKKRMQEALDALGGASTEATGSDTTQPGPTIAAADMEKAVRLERLKRLMLEQQQKLGYTGENAPLFTHGLTQGLDIPITGLAQALNFEWPSVGIKGYPGSTFSERYQAGEQIRRDELEQARKDAFVPPAAQEIAGSLISARPGETAVTSTPGMIARGAATGGGLGFVSGAASGEGDWRDRLLEGGVSGGIGAITGGTLSGAGALLANRALESTGGMTGAKEGANLLKEMNTSAADATQQMRELGPEATLLDVGHVPGNPLGNNLLQTGQRIQAAGGEGGGRIDALLRARESGKNARLESDVTQTIGPRQQPSVVLDALEARRNAVGTQYPAAKSNQVRPADLQPIADELDAEIATARGGMQRVLKRVRGMLDIPGAKGNLDPSSEGVHAMRVELDNMIKKAAPGSPEYARLNDYRKMIDAELKGASPNIKMLDTNYSQVKNEERAFETGQQIYENPRGAPTEVEFKQTFDTMSPGEKQHVLSGLNVETWRQLGIQGNDLVKLQTLLKGEGKWNTEKVAAVIGRDKTDQLWRAINREKTFNETYQKIVQGSRTAGSLPKNRGKGDGIGRNILSLIKSGAAGFGIGGIPGAASGVLADLGKMGTAGMQALQQAADSDPQLARMLTSQDPARIEKAINFILNRRVRTPALTAGTVPATIDSMRNRQQEEAR